MSDGSSEGEQQATGPGSPAAAVYAGLAPVVVATVVGFVGVELIKLIPESVPGYGYVFFAAMVAVAAVSVYAFRNTEGGLARGA